MQHFPLLNFPIDILFLILYELSVEDLVSLASVPLIATHRAVPPLLIYHRIDLQGVLLYF